ncbi:MAG: hypothetical protein A3F78_22530 [Burkholderiales bacterium RIFCSPLOWO2_12_FULL_61_40]|nr:MAG: hypothetical protein A3F78_22530 [Burkholderiales bacterium RIFCSPLOWO2_12_FULL_61_40]
MPKSKTPPSRQANTPQTDAATARTEVCLSLIAQLGTLRQSMLDREAAMRDELAQVCAAYGESARNLVHYLTLRSGDLRPIQEKLSWLGLSSLGRSESHVLANLDKVLGVLHRLTDQPWQDQSADEPAGSVRSHQLLVDHANQLLGKPPHGHPVRIMVTLPTEAAHDLGVARELIDAGMDIARINCAHGSPEEWKSMATHVRQAAHAVGRKVRILMDLGGPKIRTGEVAARPAVLRLRPQRDEYGRAFSPARLGMVAVDQNHDVPAANAVIGVSRDWLGRLKVGAQIDFSDARGAKRHMLVVQSDAQSAIAEILQTAYITPDTLLTIHGAEGKKKSSTIACAIGQMPGVLHLHRGDVLRLTKGGLGQPAAAEEDSDDAFNTTAHISCTLPQVIDQVHEGERIWFDNGRIGGVVQRTCPQWLEVGITQAREGGEKLAADKGINLPDSTLDLPALTDKDIADLVTVACEADMVGLSFVHQPEDVHQLRDQLHRLGRDDIGIVLKIETLQGFENLPELMLAAMAGTSAGVMIARGDLAVECGYERLAEVQEEILRCAEAAHMPVIWATRTKNAPLCARCTPGVAPGRHPGDRQGLQIAVQCPISCFLKESLHDTPRHAGPAPHPAQRRGGQEPFA